MQWKEMLPGLVYSYPVNGLALIPFPERIPGKTSQRNISREVGKKAPQTMEYLYSNTSPAKI